MATFSEESAFCPICKEQRLVRKQTMSRPALMIHIALSVLSVGIWLIFFGAHFMAYALGSYHCTVCGTAINPGAGERREPGWYPDPRKQARPRWWDGWRWTAHTAE